MQVRAITAALGSLLLVGLAGAESLAAQNVSYSVSPTYQEIRWDDAFGFDRTRLFGVGVAVDFGPYFSLRPFYAWEDGLEPREDLVPADGEPDLWDLEVLGADMVVNFGRGSMVPFVTGGGGVIRTTPEGEERSEHLLLRYGGGVRFDLGNRFGAEITAQNWTTRLSSPFVDGAVTDEDFPDDGLVDSWVYGAGLRIPFGGGYAATDPGQGLIPGITVEPYAARTTFADELNLDRLHAAGVRGGVDFNRNVGLRAFYWKGVDDDFSEWEDVHGYGAEARFALNTGPGLSPYLVAGVGRMRFDEGFVNLDEERPDNMDHLTLGGGLSFGLGERTRLEIGARNLLMTPGEDLEDVTAPDELVSNWQYSAGLSIVMGASPRDRADAEQDRRQQELERLREENRRLRAGEDPQVVRTEVVRAEGLRADTIQGTRTMVVPVPEVGEVILRYGDAYAVRTRDAVSGLTEEEQLLLDQRVAEALARLGVDPADRGDAQRRMQTLEDRLPELIRQILREELGAMGVQPDTRPADRPAFESQRRWEFRTMEPYAGLQLGDRNQILLGSRAVMGWVGSTVPIQLVPELAFGFGEGDTSLLLGINGRYGHPLGGDRNLEPYVQAGVALTNQRLLSLNFGYGMSFDVARGDGEALRMFVEHQGIQLYRDHRILIGVSLDR